MKALVHVLIYYMLISGPYNSVTTKAQTHNMKHILHVWMLEKIYIVVLLESSKAQGLKYSPYLKQCAFKMTLWFYIAKESTL